MSKNIRKVVDNYLDNINSASSKSNMMACYKDPQVTSGK